MKPTVFAGLACFSLAGSLTAHAQTTGGPYNPNPSSTAGSTLLISNLFANSISSVSPSGSVNATFVGSLPGPNGLATTGDGTVFAATFTAPSTPSFTRFSATTGAVLNTYGGVPAVPQGLTFGPDGSLYATTSVEPNSQQNQILRFNPATGSTTTFLSGGGLNVPQGIAVGPDGNFYVANQGNNRILQITPAGAVTNLGATGLARPTGIIFDHNTLFVSNNSGGISGYNGSIVGGTFTLGGATSPAFSLGSGGPINGPEGLTIGSNGNIYFANDDSQAGDGNTSNIDVLTVTRDANGAPTGFGPISVFATEDAALGASFVLFVVPEPSTYAMLAGAGGALALFGFRRRMTLRA